MTAERNEKAMTPTERPDPREAARQVYWRKCSTCGDVDRDSIEKAMLTLMIRCYRHAAAVAREEIRHADKLHAELGRLGENHYAKGVTDGRKDFAGKIAEVLERLATELEGEKR